LTVNTPGAGNGPVGALLSRAARARGCQSTMAGAARCPSPCTARGALHGGPVTLGRPRFLAAGLRTCLLAAPRFAAGVEVRHSGPPVPSLPHIEDGPSGCSVTPGASVEVGAGERPDHWVVRPGRLNLGDFSVEPDCPNAGPFPRGRACQRRIGDDQRLALGLAAGGGRDPGRDHSAVAALYLARRFRPHRHRVGGDSTGSRPTCVTSTEAVPAAHLGRGARVGPVDVQPAWGHTRAQENRPAGRDRQGDQRARRRP